MCLTHNGNHTEWAMPTSVITLILWLATYTNIQSLMRSLCSMCILIQQTSLTTMKSESLTSLWTFCFMDAGKCISRLTAVLAVLAMWQSIYLSGFFNSCRRLPETKHHSSLFLHWSSSKFLVVMAACTPSIHVFLDAVFSFSPVVSNPQLILLFSPLASFWHDHTIVVFSAL